MSFILPANIIERGRQRNLPPRVLQFPVNLGVHGMLFIFKEYKYSSQQSGLLSSIPETEIKDAIMLPLPSNIEDSYNVRVQGFEQGFEGALVSGSVAAFSESNSLLNGLGTLGGNLTDAFRNNPELSGSNIGAISSALAFLARRTLDAALSGSVRNIDVGAGNVVNPKAALYFDGVDLKQHSFRWTFTPNERQESDILKDIENTMKKNILPSYTRVGPLSQALLKYPSMVDIYFFGIDSEYFVKFKTCMVQSVGLNYAPQGLAVLKGGKPAAVTMNIRLIESDIHTSEDYGGASGGSFNPLPGAPRGNQQ